jgi:hypothetical protein
MKIVKELNLRSTKHFVKFCFNFRVFRDFRGHLLSPQTRYALRYGWSIQRLAKLDLI